MRDPRRPFWKCFSMPLLLIKKREKMKMKIVIVGGVAGGATAAARIRRLDEHAEITVLTSPVALRANIAVLRTVRNGTAAPLTRSSCPVLP